MDKPHVFAKSKKAVIIGVFFDFCNEASIFREMGREGLVLLPHYSTNPLFHSEGPEMAKLMVDIKTKNTLPGRPGRFKMEWVGPGWADCFERRPAGPIGDAFGRP